MSTRLPNMGPHARTTRTNRDLKESMKPLVRVATRGEKNTCLTSLWCINLIECGVSLWHRNKLKQKPNSMQNEYSLHNIIIMACDWESFFAFVLCWQSNLKSSEAARRNLTHCKWGPIEEALSTEIALLLKVSILFCDSSSESTYNPVSSFWPLFRWKYFFSKGDCCAESNLPSTERSGVFRCSCLPPCCPAWRRKTSRRLWHTSSKPTRTSCLQGKK